MTKFILALLFCVQAHAQVTITPNMNLPIPIPGITSGPAWAQAINSSFTAIDSHNHSFGQGVQITPNGLNINSDLAFGSNNATLLRTTRFTPQSSPIGNSGTDVGELYVSGNELYYNDVSGGNQVQLTASGSVNATTSGISSGTASAAFSAGSLVILSNVNVPANVKMGSAVMSNAASYPNAVTLQPPASIGSNYSITLPTVPGAQSFVTEDASGNLAPYAGISGGITGTNIASATITTTNIAPLAVSGSQIQLSTITGNQIASNTVGLGNLVNYTLGTATGSSYSNATSSYTTIVSASYSADAGNRPTFLFFTGNAFDYTDSGGGSVLSIQIQQTVVATTHQLAVWTMSIPASATVSIPIGVFNWAGSVFSAAGSSSFALQSKITSGTGTITVSPAASMNIFSL